MFPHPPARPLRVLAPALRRLLAPACLACAVEAGDPVCAACLQDFFPSDVRRCRVCANRLPAPAVRGVPEPQPEPGLCGRCLAVPRRFDATLVLADYAAPVDGMIAALKFRARLDVGRALGCLLARRHAAWRAGAGAAWPPADAVVALPLAPRRLRERGYNQAAELARALAPALGLPVLAQALVRVGERPAQHGLALAQRRTNVRGVFRCSAALAARHVLLVDDVLTSGATLDEAAGCLKAAGAATVINLVVARTP
jgi:ComF family protein